MAVHIIFRNGKKEIWHIVPLWRCDPKIKFLLALQLMAFINEVEEIEAETEHLRLLNLVRYLDDCYEAA